MSKLPSQILEIVNTIFSNAVVAALLSSAITSFFSYRFAVQREHKTRKDEKAFDAYDGVLSVLSEFRVQPSLALDDEFYLKLMRISVNLKLYGNKHIYSATENAFNNIKRYYTNYSACITKIEDEYLEWNEDEDPVTGEPVDIPTLLCPDYLYDDLCKKAKQNYTPTHKQAKEIVDTFLDNISKYIN